MQKPASVLVLSRDQHLIRTRVLLLEREGYHVLAAAALSDLAKIEPVAHIDVLVLCHTLSTEESEHAIKVANTKWPRAKVLELIAEAYSPTSTAANEVFYYMDGPKKFLQAVDGLVSHQRSAN